MRQNRRKGFTLLLPRWQCGFGALLWVVMLSVSLAGAARTQAQTPPQISDVKLLTPRVARFEPVEIAFDVTTSADYLNLPFDINPPPGLEPGAGVSVDALFSRDQFATTITQPAFFYQAFEHDLAEAADHWTPEGAPEWRVRFAPRTSGEWQAKLRVRDRDGETLFPAKGALSFHVQDAQAGRYQGLRENPYTRHGFLRVSENDPRYFEFEDGTPFLGVGYNASSAASGNVPEANTRYRNWQVNGLQFARVWLSGAGINGSHWTPWTFPPAKYQNSLPAVGVDSQQQIEGAEFSFRLDEKRPCQFAEFGQGGIPVLPNTTYDLSMRVRLNNVTPNPKSSRAGFSVFQQGWVENCGELDSSPLIPFQAGTTDWYTATTEITTGANQNFIKFLHFAMLNSEKGVVNFDDVRLVSKDDPAQVNLLRHGRADSHLYYDALNAAKWDLMIEAAANHGVFLKLVIDEKNEWLRNQIEKDGSVGKWDNNNFYGAANTKVRWLQEAWWRYLIARWGYSTAIHSFEYVNEGDPYNGNHYNAANAMARYFDEHDPSQHMVTTSLWHSFPNKEFWSNPRFEAIDYADLHAYISTGWGTGALFVPAKNIETRPEYQFQGMNSFHVEAKQQIRQSIHPRGLTLNEPGEWTIRYWMKQEDMKAKCNAGSNGSRVRVFWQLDTRLQGAVPSTAKGNLNSCSTPGGSFDWREFSSSYDPAGKELPISKRLVIKDAMPHELTLGISNSDGVSGDAWIAKVELISPSGVRTPVLGEFDATSFIHDTAWYTAAYSQLWGASSPVGARKPLVRGEAGLNSEEFPNGLTQLNQDQAGVWLHNFVWGQINSGGMYDLYWWGRQFIENNINTGRDGDLYAVFLRYVNFISDIPLNNGAYREARALASDPQLRAWGQRDDTNGHAHLWIQNRGHQWQNVIANEKIPELDGTITLSEMPGGTYRVEWWDTTKTRDPIFKIEEMKIENSLVLHLPNALSSDIAVKIERLSE